MKFKYILLLFLGLGGISITHAERILFMSGLAGRSHVHMFSALTTELARRGHEITHVTPYPIKNVPGNSYRQIEATTALTAFEKLQSSTSFKDMSMFQRLNLILSIAVEFGPSVLQVPEVKQLLDEKFDLVIVSFFFNECSLPFAYHNKAPLILIGSSGLLSFLSTNIGVPEPTSYVPSIFLPFSDEMSYQQRAINLILSVLLELIRNLYVLPRIQPIMQEFFGANVPSVKEIEANASLVITNTHPSLNYPRPLPPNVIEVGGLHIKRNSDIALPKDLQDFMDGAQHGVIYFSMGTAVRPELFGTETLQYIIAAFASLQQRVIWKWNLDTLPGKPDNVKISKWLPQETILAHPKLRLFITHGGMLSTQEAAYYGVPLIGIPVFGDQQLNVERSERLGYCLYVDLRTLTTQTLLSAIHKILETPSFKENAELIKQRVRDQPETPLQRAVFWTEYVMRHKGAQHLRPFSTRLPWYQLYQLDVLAPILLISIVFHVIIVKMLRKCCSPRKRSNVPDIKIKTN